jgi:hypothetical protein
MSAEGQPIAARFQVASTGLITLFLWKQTSDLQTVYATRTLSLYLSDLRGQETVVCASESCANLAEEKCSMLNTIPMW